MPGEAPMGGRQMWRFVQWVWLFNIAITLFLLGLPALMQKTLIPGTDTFVAVLLAVAALDIPIVWRMQRKLRAQVRGGGSLDELLAEVGGSALLVTAAANSPAILGMIAYLLSGNRVAVAGFGILSLLSLIIFRPKLEDWHDAPPTI